MCALSEMRGSLSQDSKRASTSQISVRSFGRGCQGVSLPASRFVSLFETTLEPRKMRTDFSQAPLFPASLKDRPLLPPCRLPHPTPSPNVAASQLLARKECVVLPGLLAAAPPLGSEIRTIWCSEGSQDGAHRDSSLLGGSPTPAGSPGMGQETQGDGSSAREIWASCL